MADLDIPLLDQDNGVGPPIPPRARQENQLHHLRVPPTYKQTNDLNLYLRRFESYANAIGANDAERVNILISLLDDATLSSVERHLHEHMQYDELCDRLRHEEGLDAPNREGFITQLRSRRKLRSETIRQFFLDLYRLAQKAYPDVEILRQAALRESFIANLSDAPISSRLRENPNLNTEQIVDLAVTLESCRNASAAPRGASNEVNHVNTADNTEGTDNSTRAVLSDAKLDTLINLVETLAVSSATNNVKQPSQGRYVSAPLPFDQPQPLAYAHQYGYQYIGPKTTRGLQVQLPPAEQYSAPMDYNANAAPNFVPSRAVVPYVDRTIF